LVGPLSIGLAACGSSSSATLKVSLRSGPVGTVVVVSGNAGSGCVVDKNWFGFDFGPSGQVGQGPVTKMTTPVATNGTWSATFAIPSFLSGPAKSGAGALVKTGRYDFLAPACSGHSVAKATFQVQAATGSTDQATYSGIESTTDGGGYWLVQGDGAVTAVGDAHSYGSLGGPGPGFGARIVGLAHTYDDHGYWLVGANGAVHSFGDAHAYGSLSAALASEAPVTGIAATPDGHGYWLMGANGHVYGFGDAKATGMPGEALAPYDALGTRPAGGYVVTAANDGGVYVYPGGTLASGGPGAALSATLVGTAITPSGNGAWQAGLDGGVITWGDATFYGSVPGESVVLKAPVAAIAATPDGHGYWLLGATGTVFNFGDAQPLGSGHPAK
jgi:hypothetical protein